MSDSQKMHGPETWLVCEACNYNRHVCPGCGDDLRHAETIPGPNLHACFWPDEDEDEDDPRFNHII